MMEEPRRQPEDEEARNPREPGPEDGPEISEAARYVLQYHARAVKLRVEELFPGVTAAVTVAIAAMFLSEHYGAPVMLFALLLGMAFRFVSEEGRGVPGVPPTFDRATSWPFTYATKPSSNFMRNVRVSARISFNSASLAMVKGIRTSNELVVDGLTVVFMSGA